MSPVRNTPPTPPTPPAPAEIALLDRPLPARSLVVSLLLRTEPPGMRGARLVQWCGLFGVPEGTARVALSRMLERNELTARDGVYALAGRTRDRRVAQDWSLEPRPRAWRGQWLLGIVTGGARAADERSALRDAMRRLRCAELREGLWTRPDNLPRVAAPADAWAVADEQCRWWTARPDEDPELLAGRLFDVTAWERRAALLTKRLTVATRVLGTDRDTLADAFVVGAAALAHVRADPLLPPTLVGEPKAGDALRRAYRAYEAAFARALQSWFREH
ncbi:MAG TPA: PaaX domain-containing protein, C- domain protein [Acidimicrobiia bacterium]|nr:PaaX domain-containing protein, C- domain protein [Acidimicrobiia bacterium]